MTYELLPHTADLRVVIREPDRVELYRTAVRLMRELYVGDGPVSENRQVQLEVSEQMDVDDDEIDGQGERFFRFVRELIYLYDVEQFIPAELVDPERLVVVGEEFDPERHEVHHQPKAVTRHGFAYRHTGEGYEVEMVFDI